MKVKVKIGFIDKYTKKEYSAGQVIDVSEKRYEEIMKAGKYVEEIKKENQSGEEKKA